VTVVSDTSPLNYLALIDLSGILPALFGDVLVPDAVHRELRSPAAPAKVTAWLNSSPPWLHIRVVSEVPSELRSLGAGEREAIALAESVQGGLVLLDEKKARDLARRRGLAVAGTLGLLELAASRGLVDHGEALARLRQTNFRAPARLLRVAPPPRTS
jgi:predicted nucleic acid-binding protein